MFVIERCGVTWAQRFYAGHNQTTGMPKWGPLDYAVEYHNQSKANSMSYRIDDEEGIYTTVEKREHYG